MRYFSLGMVAIGALMFPFAAKNAVLGLAPDAGHELRTAIILLVIGLILVGAGWFVSKQDDTSSVWRNRRSGKRIRLR
jgi:hypothetical protein